MPTSVQTKIDTLSAAMARGDLIDTNLNVVSKQTWSWKVLSFLRAILQPFVSCLGLDMFQAYRSHSVATALFKLCDQAPDLNAALKKKVVTQILMPLDTKTREKYHLDIEKAKKDILALKHVQFGKARARFFHQKLPAAEVGNLDSTELRS